MERLGELNATGISLDNMDDGAPFTADDVVFNITRWCDKAVEGNSMAARMGTLIDANSNKAADGAITKVDDHTVKLKTSASDITIIPGMCDYPALIVHRDFDKNPDTLKMPGTGPYEITDYQVGKQASVRRRKDFTWWGGEPYLDGVDFIDYGGEQIIDFEHVSSRCCYGRHGAPRVDLPAGRSR